MWMWSRAYPGGRPCEPSRLTGMRRLCPSSTISAALSSAGSPSPLALRCQSGSSTNRTSATTASRYRDAVEIDDFVGRFKIIYVFGGGGDDWMDVVCPWCDPD